MTDQLQRAEVDGKHFACKFDDPEGFAVVLTAYYLTPKWVIWTLLIPELGEVDYGLVNPFNRVPNWINLQRDVTLQRDELTFIRSIAFVKRTPAADTTFVMQRQFKHSRSH